MQWNQSTMYEQRVRFILEVQQGTFSFAESCRRSSPPQGRVRRKKVRRRKARLNPSLPTYVRHGARKELE